jgi:hypothetical protein
MTFKLPRSRAGPYLIHSPTQTLEPWCPSVQLPTHPPLLPPAGSFSCLRVRRLPPNGRIEQTRLQSKKLRAQNRAERMEWNDIARRRQPEGQRRGALAKKSPQVTGTASAAARVKFGFSTRAQLAHLVHKVGAAPKNIPITITSHPVQQMHKVRAVSPSQVVHLVHKVGAPPKNIPIPATSYFVHLVPKVSNRAERGRQPQVARRAGAEAPVKLSKLSKPGSGDQSDAVHLVHKVGALLKNVPIATGSHRVQQMHKVGVAHPSQVVHLVHKVGVSPENVPIAPASHPVQQMHKVISPSRADSKNLRRTRCTARVHYLHNLQNLLPARGFRPARSVQKNSAAEIAEIASIQQPPVFQHVTEARFSA